MLPSAVGNWMWAMVSPSSRLVPVSNTCSVPSSEPPRDNETATNRPSGDGTKKSIVVPPVGSNALASSTTRALLGSRSEEHTSELQSRLHLVCRLLLEKKKKTPKGIPSTLLHPS